MSRGRNSPPGVAGRLLIGRLPHGRTAHLVAQIAPSSATDEHDADTATRNEFTVGFPILIATR